MKVELVFRGYPSRIRFADWERANSLPVGALPKLSKQQRARARKLRIPEDHYAVALKAAELSSEHALGKMERVARIIAAAAKKRLPEAELTSVVWDFRENRFEFLAQINGREDCSPIPTAIVDDVLLEKEGAEERLKKAVDFELGGWAD